jgi:DmsE family decaheme c-type cytochrome
MVAVAFPITAQALWAKETPEKGDSAAYVGSETCETCHSDLAKEFWRTQKGKVFRKERNETEKRACEACHGPASAHLEDPATGVLTFKKEKQKAINSNCLNCHQRDKGMIPWMKGVHNRGDLSCVTCHKVHNAGPALLTKPGKDLCTGCHKTVEGTFKMPSRHPLKEEKVACKDCHNPHSPRIKATGVSLQQACTKCHQEKRGPFAYSHRPAAQNCLSCHTPHGSANPDLLTLRQPSLCLQCHTTLPATHGLGQGPYRECTSCHKDIHGSNRNRRFFP